MKAIILAAGKGNRLLPITNEIPKSMIEFGEMSLLERMINTFRDCGISDISIVVGHNAKKINFPNIKIFVNEKYDKTNMLESLFCAEEKIDDEVIISYADIIFEKRILKKLITSKEDITLVVDTDWLKYWKLRIDEPLDDAHETVKTDNEGNVISIGQEVKNVHDTDGHFIGLMKIQNKGAKNLKDVYYKSKLQSTDNSNPLNSNLTFENSRLVDLIQGMIRSGIKVSVSTTKNGWLEFDTVKDYEIYSNLKDKNMLSDIINLD
jgi:choline kinase